MEIIIYVIPANDVGDDLATVLLEWHVGSIIENNRVGTKPLSLSLPIHYT